MNVPTLRSSNTHTSSRSLFLLMRLAPLLSIASLLLVAGCVEMHPRFPELRRGATPVTDPGKTFTVLREIVWYGTGRAQSGIRLPVGHYTLEAEDADYWYFHAPEPLEFRVLDRGTVTEQRRIPGGIMIAKRATSFPAIGYADGAGWVKSSVGEPSGTEFAWMEGKYWTKNF
ncbi:MAG: hypothetical protein ABIZ49_02705 [Opitutaceae bacterium]